MLRVWAATAVLVGLATTNLALAGPSSLERDIPARAGSFLLDIMSHSRNERSTPRDSVLPVSPAIATSERPMDSEISTALILRTKAFLAHLGYEVGRLDQRVTAKFKAAIFRYQQAHGIPPSGELDDATIETLGSGAR